MDELIKICPRCGAAEGQQNRGRNRSGTQACKCAICGRRYTPEPMAHAYADEVRQSAIEMFCAGASGRKIGRVLNMSKANVYNWIKKTSRDSEK